MRYSTTTTTSSFLTLNIQISHHLQIARLIEAGGVQIAEEQFSRKVKQSWK